MKLNSVLLFLPLCLLVGFFAMAAPADQALAPMISTATTASDCADQSSAMEPSTTQDLFAPETTASSSSSYICGACSTVACQGKLVGAYCGSSKYCHLVTICSDGSGEQLCWCTSNPV